MLDIFKQKFRSWALRRTVESGKVVLNQRRIYILPTRRGLGFGFVLLLMLLGDINYNLSLGYTLTFLLATSGGMSMLYAFRNMAQLEITAGHVQPVFAGEHANFLFHFDNLSHHPRYQLRLHDGNAHETIFDLASHRLTSVTLSIPSHCRGWLTSGRLTLHTTFPFGLFNAWAYLHFQERCLVYPKPAPITALPTACETAGQGTHQSAGDEDFAGLRDYVSGDALPRIAWKSYARGQGLQIKQFSATEGQEIWLDWQPLASFSVEQRLSVLCRWVLMSEAQGLHYGLRLPDVAFPPARGDAHRARCLKALALYGAPS